MSYQGDDAGVAAGWIVLGVLAVPSAFVAGWVLRRLMRRV